MDDLKPVRLFLAVIRHGSFAAAARQAGTTPATVTRGVAALERRLGVQLFVRTTRKVAPTAAGESYAARIAPLVAEIDRAAEEARQGGGVAAGRLRLTAPMSFGLRVLPDLLARFRAAHPRIEVEVVLTDEFLDIVAAGFDLAVRISGPPEDKSTIWRKVCAVERVIVAAPGSAAAAARAPEDIPEAERLAHSAAARQEDWALSGPGETRRTLRAGAALSANNGDLLGRLAERGAGAALLPRFIVEAALSEGRVVRVLPGWRAPPLWLTLYYPPYARLPPAVATFSDFFEDHVTRVRPLGETLAAP